MKKQQVSLFVAFLMFGALELGAQTEKGRFMLNLHSYAPISPNAQGLLAPVNSLGIGFGTSTIKVDGFESEAKFTNFGFNTSAHYFIVDNFSGGINLNFFNQSLEPDGGNKLTSSLFLVGPEVRYYFDLNTAFKVYVKGGASFGQAKFDVEGSEEDTSDLVQFGGGVGAAIFPTRNFSVNIGLNLNGLNTTSGEGSLESTDNYFGGGLDVGFSVFFGGNRGE